MRIHTRASHLTEELSPDAAAVRLLPGVNSVGAPTYLIVAEQAGDHA